jgi:hypothetical protein
MGKSTASIYDVLKANCTIPQIQDFIRDVNTDTGAKIHVTAATKDELAHTVSEAVQSKDVDYSTLAAFVRDHEESGNQHIFFYRPKSDRAATTLNNGRSLAASLIGKRIDDGSLPSWVTRPNEFLWSDFRITPKSGPWTAKLYGLQSKRRFTNEWRIVGDEHFKVYRVDEERIVLVVHWNGSELEVRISRSGAGTAIDGQPHGENTREIDRRLDTVWELFAPCRLRNLVDEWDLSKAAHAMLDDAMSQINGTRSKKEPPIPFHCSSMKFLDSELGTAMFTTRNEKETFSTSKERKRAIETYLKGDDVTCDQTVVIWKADVADHLWGKSDLRTVVGGGKSSDKSNELTISSRVNPRTIQYVLHWIRQYDL